MAVPPIQRSAHAGPASDAKLPWLLDAVLGLLIVAALPLAIVAIPNTVSVVADLLPGDIDRLGLMRAHGLALPAMMLTVPLAAVALRRLKVAHILVAGLALLAVADAAGGYAGSTFLVGVLRVLHGIGAGVLVPATLAAAWERPPWLRALWTGMLALSLVSAQALALWPLDGVRSWRITLQPYPLLTGVSLALAAGYFLVWLVRGEHVTPSPRAKERSRLLLATVPAAGIAFVAISTANENWRPSLVVLVAVLAVAAMLALASIGSPEGRTLAYAMVAVGTVVLPSVAQITYVEMGGLGGPGLKGLWLPFCIAGASAVAASVLVRLFGGALTRWLTPLGLLAVVVGLCSVRVLVPAESGMVLVIPFTLLAVGAAVAMTAAMRPAGLGASLFGLALCFPGVLAGYLLGTGIQVMVLQGAKSAQELVDGFVGALHLWALIGGFLVVAVIVLAALLARRSAPALADAPYSAPVPGTSPSGSGTNPSGSGANLSGSGAGLSGSGTGLSGSGTGLLGSGTGLLGSGTGLSSSGTAGLSDAGTAGVAAGVAGQAAGAAGAEVPGPRAPEADRTEGVKEADRTESAEEAGRAEGAEDDGADVMAAVRARAGRGEVGAFASEAPASVSAGAFEEPEKSGKPGASGEAAVSKDEPRGTEERRPDQEAEEPRDDEDRPTGEIPRVTSRVQANGSGPDVTDQAGTAETTGPIPPVPPPTQSPEDGTTP
ncbi:hypothetical protein ACIBHX_00025 [Nonomuraea sp. NPDC050536]|uniref:hypothetical protein n=1 Tax=Nonomuraea sp. NPDC050536 TaxID=3364366 RepID=UPI0037C5DC07